MGDMLEYIRKTMGPKEPELKEEKKVEINAGARPILPPLKPHSDSITEAYKNLKEDVVTNTVSKQEKVKIGGKTPVDLNPSLKPLTVKDVAPAKEDKKKKVAVESKVQEGLFKAIGGLLGGVGKIAGNRALNFAGVHPKTLGYLGKRVKSGWGGKSKPKVSVGATKPNVPALPVGNHPPKKRGMFGGIITPEKQADTHALGSSPSSGSGPEQTAAQKAKNVDAKFVKGAKSGHTGYSELPPSGGRMSAGAYRAHVGLPPAGGQPNKPKSGEMRYAGKGFTSGAGSAGSPVNKTHSRPGSAVINLKPRTPVSTKMSPKVNPGLLAKSFYKAAKDINAGSKAATPMAKGDNKLGQLTRFKSKNAGGKTAVAPMAKGDNSTGKMTRFQKGVKKSKQPSLLKNEFMINNIVSILKKINSPSP